MPHPLTSCVKEGAWWKIAGVFLMAVIGLIVVSAMDKFINVTPEMDVGYSNMEYAGNATNVNIVFAKWTPTARAAAAFSAGFHYYNLVFYVGFEVLANVWAAHVMRDSFPRLAIVSDVFSWLIIPAAVLYGLVQFFIIYQIIIYEGLSPMAELTGAFSATFIATLAAGILWFVIMLIVRLVTNCRDAGAATAKDPYGFAAMEARSASVTGAPTRQPLYSPPPAGSPVHEQL